MAVSIRFIWSTVVVDGGAEGRDESAGRGRLEAMGAEVAVSIKIDLSWVPVERKENGAAEGW